MGKFRSFHGWIRFPLRSRRSSSTLFVRFVQWRTRRPLDEYARHCSSHVYNWWVFHQNLSTRRKENSLTLFPWLSAACLAEICSSIPLSGSIYIWAAEAGGKKYGRFFGFIVWVFLECQPYCSTNILINSSWSVVLIGLRLPGLLSSRVTLKVQQTLCSQNWPFSTLSSPEDSMIRISNSERYNGLVQKFSYS